MVGNWRCRRLRMARPRFLKMWAHRLRVSETDSRFLSWTANVSNTTLLLQMGCCNERTRQATASSAGSRRPDYGTGKLAGIDSEGFSSAEACARNPERASATSRPVFISEALRSGQQGLVHSGLLRVPQGKFRS